MRSTQGDDSMKLITAVKSVTVEAIVANVIKLFTALITSLSA